MTKFYVESLPRISSVSVFVEDDDLTLESIIQVDQQLLKVNLANKPSLLIPLPVQVPQLPNIQQCCSIRDNTLSIRLPSAYKVADRSTNSLMMFGSTYKWDSKYCLQNNPFLFNCQCGVERLNSKDIKQIDEMPSELWTEMMDVWYCHKPNDEKTYSERFCSLKPLPDAIITGAYYIAFNIQDNIMKNVSDIDGILYCDHCHEIVGEFDKSSQLEKIFKWTMVLKHGNKEEKFNPYSFTYSSLLDNVNRNATRVVEYVNKSKSSRLLIWAFNVGINYAVQGFSGSNALKVYYTTSDNSIEQERKDRGGIEQVIVPDIVLVSTIEHFEKITNKLPKSLREMGDRWLLGLLNYE